MLHPSYTELMKIINQDSEDDTPVINSRYSIVMATAKRARQIVADGSHSALEGGRRSSLRMKTWKTPVRSLRWWIVSWKKMFLLQKRHRRSLMKDPGRRKSISDTVKAKDPVCISGL